MKPEPRRISMPFECLEVALEAVRAVKPVIDQIAKHDPESAGQLRRSAGSVPRHIAEARERGGRDRTYRYGVARGEAGESVVTIRTAIGWDHCSEALAAPSLALFDRVRAMLWRLTH
jgi:four helix bundle protein